VYDAAGTAIESGADTADIVADGTVEITVSLTNDNCSPAQSPGGGLLESVENRKFHAVPRP
jgi:hypothetical protein